MNDKTALSRSTTFRAVALGVLAVIGFTVAGCFSVLLRYEIIGTGYLPRGALALLLLLVLANAIIGRFAKKLRLLRNEILLIFIMLLGMAIIPGQDFAQHFYLNIVGLVYYTTPDIASPELYLNDLNPALVPSIDRESPEIRWAFEGAPPGKQLPYQAWIKPLAIWTPYMFALYWMMLFFAAIISPRWEDEEKLLFPLMQVPNEMTDLSTGWVPELLRNKLMWTCFGMVVLLYTVKGLHTYFPTIPDINLQQTTKQVVAGGPGVVFNNVALHIYPEMIGIAYLLTSEVGFSMWFFYLLRLVEDFTRNMIGIQTSSYQFFEFQTTGAYVALGLALLWSARRHIAGVVAYAFGMGPAPVQVAGGRPQPYRMAVWGFIVCFSFAIIWATQVGVSFTWALVYIGLMPLIGLVVSRVICEAGMFLYTSPFRLNESLFRIFGTQHFGPKNLTLMSAMSWVQVRDTGSHFMPLALQSLKLGSMADLDRKHVLWLVMLGTAVAILTCHVVCPYVIYTWGVPKLGWWERTSSLGAVNRLVSFIRNKSEMLPGDWAALGAGGLVTMFLVAMRQRFLWWPLHPAGFVAWLGWPIDRYWLSFLLGWLVKIIVLRFWGYKAFAQLRPAAFGFILGICFMLTFWLVFHFFVEGPPVLIE